MDVGPRISAGKPGLTTNCTHEMDQIRGERGEGEKRRRRNALGKTQRKEEEEASKQKRQKTRQGKRREEKKQGEKRRSSLLNIAQYNTPAMHQQQSQQTVVHEYQAATKTYVGLQAADPDMIIIDGNLSESG